MTVYADILIAVNLYIDFFLLWCVKKLLHLGIKNRRLAAGAMVGAVCALTALLPELPPWAALLTSAVSSVGVSAAAFAPMSLKMLLKAAASFWAATFLLAGFFLFLIRFFAPKSVALFGSVVYFDLSPLLLFIFTCAAYGIFWLGQKLFPRGSPKGRFYRLVVENMGTRAELFLKADTGNALREPFSALPVIICRDESLQGTAPKEAEGFLSGAEKFTAADGLRAIPFESIGGSGLLPAFKPERVIEMKSGKIFECYIALCGQKLFGGEIDGIFNPDMFYETEE